MIAPFLDYDRVDVEACVSVEGALGDAGNVHKFQHPESFSCRRSCDQKQMRKKHMR